MNILKWAVRRKPRGIVFQNTYNTETLTSHTLRHIKTSFIIHSSKDHSLSQNGTESNVHESQSVHNKQQHGDEKILNTENDDHSKKENEENINTRHHTRYLILLVALMCSAGYIIITSDEFLELLIQGCIKCFLNHPEMLDMDLHQLKIEAASGCFTCGSMIWNNVSLGATYYEPILKRVGDEMEYTGRFNVYEINVDAPTMKVKLPLDYVLRFLWARRDSSFEFMALLCYNTTFKVKKIASDIEAPENMPEHLSYYHSRRLSSLTAHEFRLFNCKIIYEDDTKLYQWNVNRLQNLCSTKSFNLPFFLTFRSTSRSLLTIEPLSSYNLSNKLPNNTTSNKEAYVLVMDSALDEEKTHLKHRWVISKADPEKIKDPQWSPQSNDDFFHHASDELFITNITCSEYHEADEIKLSYHDKQGVETAALAMPHEDIFSMGEHIDVFLNPIRKIVV